MGSPTEPKLVCTCGPPPPPPHSHPPIDRAESGGRHFGGRSFAFCASDFGGGAHYIHYGVVFRWRLPPILNCLKYLIVYKLVSGDKIFTRNSTSLTLTSLNVP